MRIRFHLRWIVPLASMALLVCLLSLHRPAPAQPRAARVPLVDANAQRLEMIRLLEETNALLRAQNALLRSGQLRVAAEPPR